MTERAGTCAANLQRRGTRERGQHRNPTRFTDPSGFAGCDNLQDGEVCITDPFPGGQTVTRFTPGAEDSNTGGDFGTGVGDPFVQTYDLTDNTYFSPFEASSSSGDPSQPFVPGGTAGSGLGPGGSFATGGARPPPERAERAGMGNGLAQGGKGGPGRDPSAGHRAKAGGGEDHSEP
jgi:hypothetical protein